MLLSLLLSLASPAWALDVACRSQRPGESACETGRLTIPEGPVDIHGQCAGSAEWNLWSNPEGDKLTIGFWASDVSGSCSMSYLHPDETRAETNCENPAGKKIQLVCETLAPLARTIRVSRSNSR
jgi:hypothetical protein